MFFLTEQDKKILQKLIAREKQRFPELLNKVQERALQMSPEVYIARHKDVNGTIGAIDGDEPGMAPCHIFKIDHTADPPVLEAITYPDGTNKELEVWNIAPQDIPYGYLEVRRTKFGRWLAAVSGDAMIIARVIAPEDGISSGQTRPCEPTWFSDGRDLGPLPIAPLQVENTMGVTVGETGNHVMLVHTKDADWHVLVDVRACEDML